MYRKFYLVWMEWSFQFVVATWATVKELSTNSLNRIKNEVEQWKCNVAVDGCGWASVTSLGTFHCHIRALLAGLDGLKHLWCWLRMKGRQKQKLEIHYNYYPHAWNQCKLSVGRPEKSPTILMKISSIRYKVCASGSHWDIIESPLFLLLFPELRTIFMEFSMKNV